jgi:hypothetical protein
MEAPMGKIGWIGLRRAKWLLAAADTADAAVVLTMSVADTDDAVVIDIGAATEQLGTSTVPGEPVTAQESITVPEKPPLGVIVIVEVPLAPGEVMLTGVLVSAKPGGGAFTATATLV